MSDSATRNRLRKAYEDYRAATEFERDSDFDHDRFVSELYDKIIASGDDLNSDYFPELYNLSAAFMYKMLPVPTKRMLPEFVYVPSTLKRSSDDEEIKLLLAISQWNLCWEAAQQRIEIFNKDLPDRLKWLRRYSSENIYLLPRSKLHRYNSHAVLFHMLPADVLLKYGLPTLKKGFWPHIREDLWHEAMLPSDFDDRLSRAFAHVVCNVAGVGP
jgi:hypothetical protein